MSHTATKESFLAMEKPCAWFRTGERFLHLEGK